MKKKFITLRGLKEVLTDRELKNVLGGSGTGPGSGSCGWSCPGWYDCGVSKAEAMRMAAYCGGNWCCDSCSTSTYCNWYFN